MNINDLKTLSLNYKHLIYESMKLKLIQENLNSAEYESRLKLICEILEY